MTDTARGCDVRLRDATVERVRSGDLRALARCISRIEAGAPEARTLSAAAYKSAGRAHVVGITGVPGSGKSTLVGSLVREIRRSGRRVAVIAVDPSSPFSGGAILGDRIRMDDSAMDDGVFIRSIASRGATGGLAHVALSIVDLMDTAGFDLILVETVGVGQDEVDIASASHTTIVISAPGLGDEVQAIKAGILEIADIHVVTKADRADANRTVADLRAMLALGTSEDGALWNTPVLACSAPREQGFDELLVQLDRHRELRKTPLGVLREFRIARYRAMKAAEEFVRQRFLVHDDSDLAVLLSSVTARDTDPQAAAEALLGGSSVERAVGAGACDLDES